MARYRVAAVNGRSWITDTFPDSGAVRNALGGGSVGWIEFSGLPFEDERAGNLPVMLSKKAIVSFEELPS